MTPKQSLQEYYSTIPEFKSIPSDQLVSGMDYQRIVKDKNVRAIVDNFNPVKFDPPIVSFRDGRYLLVDGQHRTAALQYMNGGKPTNVWCRVFRGLDYFTEVAIVTHHDEGHTSMTQLEHITAASKGDDQEALLCRQFLEANKMFGVTLTNYSTDTPNEYVAVKTLRTAYEKYGVAIYGEVMNLLNECWHGADGAKKNQIINVMFAFVAKYQGKYNRKRVVTRFGQLSCNQLLVTAKTMTGTITESMLVLLVNAYNKGATEDKRL